MKRPLTERTIPPSHLRVLAAIMEGHATGRVLTFRQILSHLGLSPNSVNVVARAINRLATAGLVTWEPGKKRTLRPTCRFEPA